LKQDLPNAEDLDPRRTEDSAPRLAERGWGLEVGGLLGAITVSGAVFLGAHFTGGGAPSSAQISGSTTAGTTLPPAVSPPPSPSVSLPSQPAPTANAGIPPNSASPTPSPPRQPPVPPSREGADSNPTTYVVRDGDTMWKVTGLALGLRSTPAKIATSWRAIWDANRPTIGTNPNVLQTGQVLIIPGLA